MAFDCDDAFCFYIPECLGTDACQSGTDRDGFLIFAVIESLASDRCDIISDHDTGKVFLSGKSFGPYRNYFVGNACAFDGKRNDYSVQAAVGSSVTGDGLPAGYTLDQRRSCITQAPLCVQSDVLFDLKGLSR